MSQNPFEAPPAEGQARTYFGRLRLITRSVDLVKGASYIEPGMTRQDGTPWEFKGKFKKDDGTGQHTHVIVTVETRNRDGGTYEAFRDFMYWGSDKCQQVTMPSLREHFGEKLTGIFGKSAWAKVHVEEVEDGDFTRQTFVVDSVFENRQEMEAAEDTHFSQFNQTPQEIADDIPGFEEPEPVGMSKEQAVNLLQTLFDASGKNYDAFVKQIEGMPVVLKALGSIDAEEIKSYAG